MILDGERRRALALLARSPNGRTKTYMLSQGWTRQLLGGLVRAGLATLRKPSAPSPHKAFGTTASPPRIKHANGKAGVEAERRDLVAEILRLSPPAPGRERRA